MAGTTRAARPPLPIATLTLRQFAHGKAVRVVALFAAVPVIFGLIYLIGSETQGRLAFLHDLFRNGIAPTVLPMAILILATNALGNEVEDRTMVYLVLKPQSRLRIVLEKLLAVAAVATLLLWAGTVVAYLIVMRGEAGDALAVLVAMLVAEVFAVLAYGALFLLLSLLISRALLAGILYALLWETTFSRFIPGVRLLSVRHFVESIYVRLADNPVVTMDNPNRLVSAVATLLILAVLATAAAAWRLRTMNLE